MRIGFIEDTPLHGGTQIWVSEATHYFLEKGEAVTVLCPTNTWMLKQVEETAAEVFTYDWDGVVEEGEDSRKTWTEALANCDVALCTVHPPRDGFHCSVFAARCIDEGGLQTCLVPKTGTIVPEYKREYYDSGRDINYAVVAITGFTRDYLINEYEVPADKVTLVYQGTEISRFQPSKEGYAESLKHYSLPDNAFPVLGCVGSFEERKGLNVLIETVRRLADGPLPHVHAMLVGDGPDEAMLKQQVRELELEEHVSFFPFTRKPDIVFERLDITVLSSLYKEGLPNVLLESMAMSVPVVASRIAGVPEIVIDGETGYMVEPGDPVDLATGIEKLAADAEKCRRMGENGCALVTSSHDKHAQFDAFLEYFRQIAH